MMMTEISPIPHRGFAGGDVKPGPEGGLLNCDSGVYRGGLLDCAGEVYKGRLLVEPRRLCSMIRPICSAMSPNAFSRSARSLTGL